MHFTVFFGGFGVIVLSYSGICSGARGVMPGGGMTQASKLQQIAELVGSLDANQTRTGVLCSRCWGNDWVHKVG